MYDPQIYAKFIYISLVIIMYLFPPSCLLMLYIFRRAVIEFMTSHLDIDLFINYFSFIVNHPKV